MRQKGPIEKEDPNAVRKKLSPKAKEQIMKMTEDSGKGMIWYERPCLSTFPNTEKKI